MMLAVFAVAAFLAKTSFAGPIPESLTLILPYGPVPFGTNWSVGVDFGGAVREQAFRAMQLRWTSSNGTDMFYNGTSYDPPGYSNLGNYTGSWINHTDGTFATLPEEQPLCTPVQTTGGQIGRWSPLGAGSWPPDTYTVHARQMVWVGTKGVQEEDPNSWCITPPFTNYSVQATAEVQMLAEEDSGNGNEVPGTITTTVSVTTSLDAFGNAQPTHIIGSSAGRDVISATMLVSILALTCMCISWQT